MQQIKVLAINSSPNADKGTTAKMLRPLIEGMQAEGAQADIVNLRNLTINPCLGCLRCWTETPGICVHHDDMGKLLEKYVAANIIIFGTPLYVFNVSGLMKNFIDRIIPLALPYLDTEPTAEALTSHPFRYKMPEKKILLVSPCGFPEFQHFEILIKYFEFLAKRTQFDYTGAILRPAAWLMEVEPMRQKCEAYFADLKKAGQQLVRDGKIAVDLNQRLHELWMEPQMARDLVNQHFKEGLEKVTE